jgi:hypothetical protein
MLQAKVADGICEIAARLVLNLVIVLGALVNSPRLAIATLGESADSIAADQRVLGGQLQTPGEQQPGAERNRQTAPSESYTVQQITTPAGMIVNEYVSPDGTVFAVSWRGPRLPDLAQLLGTYFADFQTAAAVPGRQQRHLVLKTERLVVETGGHMRDFRGRAYVPSLLPPNFSTEEIQ